MASHTESQKLMQIDSTVVAAGRHPQSNSRIVTATLKAQRASLGGIVASAQRSGCMCDRLKGLRSVRHSKSFPSWPVAIRMDKGLHASSPQTGHLTDWDVQPARR